MSASSLLVVDTNVWINQLELIVELISDSSVMNRFTVVAPHMVRDELLKLGNEVRKATKVKSTRRSLKFRNELRSGVNKIPTMESSILTGVKRSRESQAMKIPKPPRSKRFKKASQVFCLPISTRTKRSQNSLQDIPISTAIRAERARLLLDIETEGGDIILQSHHENIVAGLHADMSILDCCFYYKHILNQSTILLSRDRILCILAFINSIKAVYVDSNNEDVISQISNTNIPTQIDLGLSSPDMSIAQRKKIWENHCKVIIENNRPNQKVNGYLQNLSSTPQLQSIIILDTSTLLENLSLVKKLVNISTYVGFLIVIPYVVIKDLDVLKCGTSMVGQSRKATKFLQDEFTSKSPRIIGQTYRDFLVSGLSGDESIYDCCRYYYDRLREFTIIISNDIVHSHAPPDINTLSFHYNTFNTSIEKLTKAIILYDIIPPLNNPTPICEERENAHRIREMLQFKGRRYKPTN